MSNPPRRSRPRKPGQTIDLTAERMDDDVPPEPDTADAPGRTGADDGMSDPEARLGEEASPVQVDPSAATGIEPEGVSVLGEPDPGDRNAPPGIAERSDGSSAESLPDSPAEPDVPAFDRATAGETETNVEENSAEANFAAEESLGADHDRTDAPPHEELDAETILAAAEPHEAQPPRPELDYHKTSSHPPETHGPGLGTLLGAGLLGAAIALLAGGLLQYAGLIPAVRQLDMAQLTQQFARTGDVQQLTTDLNTMRNDVGQLQSALSAGGAGGTGPTGADFAALTDRVNGIEGRVNAGGGSQPAPPAIDPNALKATGDAATAARDTAGQAQAAAGEARQTAEGAQAQAAEARQTASTARQAAETAQQAAGVAQQAATGAMDVANANKEAVADIQNRIAAVEAANRQAAVAISAANLKAAVDRGGPFMAELESFATAAGNASAVDALRDFAAEGVPTVAALTDEWPDVRKAVLGALKPVDPDAGIGTQIVSGLSSLVTVRPSGTAGSGGQGPDATIARLDAALEGGDLKRWDAEWQTLPQAGKDASAAFGKKVRARADAEGVVAQALNGAVQSIGKSG